VLPSSAEAAILSLLSLHIIERAAPVNTSSKAKPKLITSFMGNSENRSTIVQSAKTARTRIRADHTTSRGKSIGAINKETIYHRPRRPDCNCEPDELPSIAVGSITVTNTDRTRLGLRTNSFLLPSCEPVYRGRRNGLQRSCTRRRAAMMRRLLVGVSQFYHIAIVVGAAHKSYAGR
jgi:hypothetical protein